MHLHQASHQSQSQAQTALRMVERMVDLGEQVENLREHLGGNADAGVANPEHDLGSLDSDAQADLSAGLGVLGRIVQEVGEDLGHPDRVGLDKHRAGGKAIDRRWCCCSMVGRLVSTA